MPQGTRKRTKKKKNKVSRRKEITNIRAEINKKEIFKKQIKNQ